MNNMLTDEALKKYHSIQLFERYKALADSFQSESTFDNYNKEHILEVIRGLGYDFSFDKREDFFGFRTLDGNFEFKINISLKFGVVETILWAKNLTSKEQYGGPLSRIVKLIQLAENNGHLIKVPYPRFSSYEDLELIIKELLNIFFDFKTAIKSDNK